MVSICLKPTSKAERYLKRDGVDVCILETILNFYLRYIDKRKPMYKHNVKLDIDCRKTSSEYYFKHNEIIIAGLKQSGAEAQTKPKRLEYLLSHLMHEFRHFVQDRIFNRDVSEITYENSDVNSGSDAYYNNPLEKDANKFEAKSLPKALSLYKCLKRAKLRNIDSFTP